MQRLRIEGRLTVTRPNQARRPGSDSPQHSRDRYSDPDSAGRRSQRWQDAAAPAPHPMSGTAAFDPALVGGGNTLDEALADLIAMRGTVQCT